MRSTVKPARSPAFLVAFSLGVIEVGPERVMTARVIGSLK